MGQIDIIFSKKEELSNETNSFKMSWWGKRILNSERLKELVQISKVDNNINCANSDWSSSDILV